MTASSCLKIAPVILIAFGLCETEVSSAKARPSVTVIKIESMQFEPKRLSIARGAVVEWINHDLVPHTATSPGLFDSKTILPGKSWKYTVQKKGRFDYKCDFHPTMSASIEVK